MSGHGARQGECWCCGRDGRWARGLCRRCYCRWHRQGFTGPGPGLERIPYAEKARDYEPVITSLSARQAAENLGISQRTVTRYRRALREAS